MIEPVEIDERLLHRIGVREWGLPSLITPGQIWRSQENKTISCMLPSGPDNVRIETRKLVVVSPWRRSWMPKEWREALWEYAKEWPHSGSQYGPFLSVSEKERCDFIRMLCEKLLRGDNIGCRSIAHDIGMMASVEYELQGRYEQEGSC